MLLDNSERVARSQRQRPLLRKLRKPIVW